MNIYEQLCYKKIRNAENKYNYIIRIKTFAKVFHICYYYAFGVVDWNLNSVLNLIKIFQIYLRKCNCFTRIKYDAAENKEKKTFRDIKYTFYDLLMTEKRIRYILSCTAFSFHYIEEKSICYFKNNYQENEKKTKNVHTRYSYFTIF